MDVIIHRLFSQHWLLTEVADNRPFYPADRTRVLVLTEAVLRLPRRSVVLSVLRADCSE
ncbi:hypothetical protein [Streptomyces sp. NPDC051000]|uniref:hypothetical protein n=1 Tax=Streptomyces sp. NPDC051000 TaxID=3155520 RepID=UPI0033E30028